MTYYITMEGPGGSMSYVVGLPNNSYKPITNTAWVRTRLCKLQKWYTRLTAASDKVYKLLSHDQWFCPCTLASSTTKTGRHDIAEILLKVALNTKIQIQIQNSDLLLALIRNRLHEQFTQEWHSLIQNSPKAINYRLFKNNFEFQIISIFWKTKIYIHYVNFEPQTTN